MKVCSVVWMLSGMSPKAGRYKPRHCLLSGIETWLRTPPDYISQSPLRSGRPCDFILANCEWAKVGTSLPSLCLQNFPDKPPCLLFPHLLAKQNHSPPPGRESNNTGGAWTPASVFAGGISRKTISPGTCPWTVWRARNKV